MLIPTIAFEINDHGVINEFLVENTPENQKIILGHRYTRAIKFVKTFDFDFAKNETVIAAMIDPIILIELFANASVSEREAMTNDEIKIDFTRPIQFGSGWNCCKGNETHVVVFDNGARWATCKGCASAYTGPVYTLESQFVPVAGI